LAYRLGLSRAILRRDSQIDPSKMMRRSSLDSLHFLLQPSMKVVDMTPSSMPPMTTTTSFLTSSTSASFFNLFSSSNSTTTTNVSPKAPKKVQNLEQKYRQADALLGLQENDILLLLREAIPSHCGRIRSTRNGKEQKFYTAGEQELLNQCQHRVAEILVERWHTSGIFDSPNDWPRNVLEDIAGILQAFLDHVSRQELRASRRKDARQQRSLEPALLAKIHINLGLLRQCTCGPHSAIESLQKALWIQNKHFASLALQNSPNATAADSATASPFVSTSPTAITAEEIGMTCHRLALAYGKAGQVGNARALLQATLYHYEKPESALCGKSHHPLVVTAQDGLTNVYANRGDTSERSEDDDAVPGLRRSSMSSSSPNSSRSLSGPSRRRMLMKATTKDWSSLPAMPVLQSSSEEE
jgi:hypothetical protein